MDAVDHAEVVAEDAADVRETVLLVALQDVLLLAEVAADVLVDVLVALVDAVLLVLDLVFRPARQLKEDIW